MGDHSREGDSAGEAPFDEDPLTGEPDKPGRLGLGTEEVAGVNPGGLLCNLANEPFDPTMTISSVSTNTPLFLDEVTQSIGFRKR